MSSSGTVRKADIAGKEIKTTETTVFLAVLVIYSVVVLLIGSEREYFGYGVETDYIGSFVPEAERALAGEPMLSQHHPPFYPLIIAFAYGLVGDWLTAGLLVSLVSGVLALVAAFYLFWMLAGRAAAWGSVVALFGSSVFMTYSLEATSDIFFLAEFMIATALAAAAVRTRALILWAGCGATIMLALMTRTNGLSLVLLGLGIFLVRGPGWRAHGVRALSFGGGFIVILACFLAFALATGSNLRPSESYRLLAAAHFVETSEPLSGDALAAAGSQFSSLFDVLTHDPVRLATSYAESFYELMGTGLNLLLEPPLDLVFLPGLVLLLGRRPSPELWLVLVAVIGQVLLVGLAPYSARYFLFLVPLAGAGVGQMVRCLMHEPWWPQRAGPSILLAVAILAAVLATVKSRARISAETSEIAQVVPLVRGLIPPSATILARKPHLALAVEANFMIIPRFDELEELRDVVERLREDGPVYVFYGREEIRTRPEYAALAAPAEPPTWLEPVLRSPSPGGWIVYRFVDETQAGSDLVPRSSTTVPGPLRQSDRDDHDSKPQGQPSSR